MTEQEYQSIWREIRKNCRDYMRYGEDVRKKYNHYDRTMFQANLVGLDLFSKQFRVRNGYSLSYDEYERFMLCAEEMIKDYYFTKGYTKPMLAFRVIDSIRIAQYYVYVKLKNNLRRKMKRGEVLSEDELMVINWRKIY